MTRSSRTIALGTVAALAAALVPPLAAAAVAEATAGGMQIRQQLQIAAPPARVYAALVDVARWWDPAHTYSGDSANLHLDAVANGCWCERLPAGGSVVHMTVFQAVPGVRLVLRGALGPLQAGGVDGAMTFRLEAAGEATSLGFTYNVGGYFPGGLDQIAPGVDGVWTLQLARLKRYVETGKP